MPQKQLTPSYANIKVPSTSPAHRYTQHKIPAVRIKGEIRYLHFKKQQLNLQIYHLHISLANMWNNTWPHIQQTIEEKTRRETKTKYKTLDKKLKKLKQTRAMTPQGPRTFCPSYQHRNSFASKRSKIQHTIK